MSGPYFETWERENLVKFAKEAYEKLQRQEEELQRLRWPFPETRPATREEKIVRPGVYEVPVEQEPVAWVTGWHDGHCVIRAANPSAILPIGIALYTTPPRREWVGLTDTDIEEVWADENLGRYATSYAIEAKLKEKNS